MITLSKIFKSLHEISCDEFTESSNSNSFSLIFSFCYPRADVDRYIEFYNDFYGAFILYLRVVSVPGSVRYYSVSFNLVTLPFSLAALRIILYKKLIKPYLL